MKQTNFKNITIKRTLILAFGMMLFSTILFSQTKNENYIDGEIYLKVKDNYKVDFDFKSKSPNIDIKNVPFLEEAKRRLDFSVKSSLYFAKSEKLRRTLRISTQDYENIDKLIRELEQLEQVEYVEKVPINRTSLTPNDLGGNTTTGQWGLHKIEAEDAWTVTTGSSSIVVAVVDNAFQTNHPDLAGKFVTGRDVSDNDSNTNPPNAGFSHGTHVAGIVGAKTNNGTGIASVGYDVSIMPVKATPNNGNNGYIYDGYEGITWAADNGADVINMSWGGNSFSTTAQNIINDASAQGVILVAAAGNNNSADIHYPAGYNQVISVAATDINDNKASFSNYGSWIDVSAPGASINSTVPYGNYSTFNGTSMASPMVAGLCGLILSVNPMLSSSQVEDCLTGTTDYINSFVGSLGTGRINAHQAVLCAGTPDLVIQSKFLTYFDLDCGQTGNASCYIKNEGDSSSGTSYIGYYLSTDTNLDANDYLLAQKSVGSINPGSIAGPNIVSFVVPNNLVSGTYYILFVADHTNQINETNESNNIANLQVTISCDGCIEFSYEGFESNWGIWNDGGSDCIRHNKPERANTGNFSILIRDNTASSVMTTDNFNFSAHEKLIVDFSYYPNSMDGPSEDFWLQISTNGGTSFTTVEEWNKGDEFENNQRYYESVTISGPFSSNTKIRFRCDANGNGDHIFIDDVYIYTCTENGTLPKISNDNSPTIIETDKIEAMAKKENKLANLKTQPSIFSELKNFPNPFSKQTTIEFNLQKQVSVTLTVSNMAGKQIAVLLNNEQLSKGTHQAIFDSSNYPSGIYYYTLEAGINITTQKMSIVK